MWYIWWLFLQVYLASLIRSILALHNLITNKINNRDAEKKNEEARNSAKDEKEKEKKEADKEKKDGDKEKTEKDSSDKDKSKSDKQKKEGAAANKWFKFQHVLGEFGGGGARNIHTCIYLFIE